MRSPILALLSIVLLSLAVSTADGQTWNIQLVDDAGDVGYYSQIVSLSDGTPCLAYKAASTIRLARWVEEGGESGWVFREMATNVYGQNFKMIIDDLDHLQFVWTSSSTVTYGVFDIPSNSWLLGPQSVGITGSSWNLDLAVFRSGADRIPYVALAANNNSVKVATRDPVAGTWSNETVADGTHPPTGPASIALDSARGIHVSFCEYTGEYNLMYAVKAAGGSSWLLQTVDPGGTNVNVGEYSSILVDQSDVVHIAYYDRTNRDLKYATPVTP